MRSLMIAVTLVTVTVLAVGCGKDSTGGMSAGSGVTAVPTTTPSPSASGSVNANVTIVSQAAFDNYIGWTSNTPTNVKVTLNLTKIANYAKTGGGTDYGYGGTVTISFKDASGNSYSDSFTSMLQSGPNTVSTESQNNQYNLLSTDYPETNGLPGYHGFFQGTTYCNGQAWPAGSVCYGQIFGGAVIIVLDSLGFNADGSGPTTGSGSIWYKNFVGTGPINGPVPGTSCWFISAGPYQCREWLSGSGVATKRSIYPDGTGGYQKLGDFTGLDLTAAFNGQLK